MGFGRYLFQSGLERLLSVLDRPFGHGEPDERFTIGRRGMVSCLDWLGFGEDGLVVLDAG